MSVWETPAHILTGTYEDLKTKLAAHFWGKKVEHDTDKLAEQILEALRIQPAIEGQVKPLSVADIQFCALMNRAPSRVTLDLDPGAPRDEFYKRALRLEAELKRDTRE